MCPSQASTWCEHMLNARTDGRLAVAVKLQFTLYKVTPPLYHTYQHTHTINAMYISKQWVQTVLRPLTHRLLSDGNCTTPCVYLSINYTCSTSLNMHITNQSLYTLCAKLESSHINSSYNFSFMILWHNTSISKQLNAFRCFC